MCSKKVEFLENKDDGEGGRAGCSWVFFCDFVRTFELVRVGEDGEDRGEGVCKVCLLGDDWLSECIS